MSDADDSLIVSGLMFMSGFPGLLGLTIKITTNRSCQETARLKVSQATGSKDKQREKRFDQHSYLDDFGTGGVSKLTPNLNRE